MGKDSKKIKEDLVRKIENIKHRCNGQDKNLYKILGINYLIATIKTFDEIDRGRIFSDEDFSDDEYPNYTIFSKIFIFKRLRRLNILLDEFCEFHAPSYEEIIKEREDDLKSLLDGFSHRNEKWLDENGLYSFYNGLKEGYITDSEFGNNIEIILEGILLKD